ncbi:hypothetical protein ACLOJK_012707 [Asimina triloba]
MATSAAAAAATPPSMLLLFVLFLLLLLELATAQPSLAFIYNGFHNATVSLNGVAQITSDGLIRLTNTTEQQIGHAFYPEHLIFKNSNVSTAQSFSTTFVFVIVHEDPALSGHGICFVISPSKDLPGALPSQYLGLFNSINNGNPSNHVFAVELDTIQSKEFADINDNHVGVDLNSLISTVSAPASYFTAGGRSRSLQIASGDAMQVWIEYDGGQKQLNVTLSPIGVVKPSRPLLSTTVNLSSVLTDDAMFVGFSSSTGSMLTSHYILGWSFALNGQAQALDLSILGPIPRRATSNNRSLAILVGIPLIAAALCLVFIWGVIFLVRKIRYAEILEDWEIEYGPQRFAYKDLFIATKGFKDGELLGVGGFGRVYRGVLPKSGIEVAVKKVSHESRQGMREFVAEIASIGRIRHDNLVRLLGYCRRKGELLLVYDFMKNGSLDKLIFGQKRSMIDWNQRFRIIKGVASGLLYLHEEWVKVVLHRDIKSSNVLLDSELNGRLGDFGLARLYDRGSDPQTTHIVGTIGYLSPEFARTGKATTYADVFSFGVFMLEVACGRKPIEGEATLEEVMLVDWVLECCKRGDIKLAADPRLEGEFGREEMELVLKLGLVCAHPCASARPSMRQVVPWLEGGVAMAELEMSPEGFTAGDPAQADQLRRFTELMNEVSSASVDEWSLSGGR